MRAKMHKGSGYEKSDTKNIKCPHEIDGPCRPAILRSYFVILAVIEGAPLKEYPLVSDPGHSKPKYKVQNDCRTYENSTEDHEEHRGISKKPPHWVRRLYFLSTARSWSWGRART